MKLRQQCVALARLDFDSCDDVNHGLSHREFSLDGLELRDGAGLSAAADWRNSRIFRFSCCGGVPTKLRYRHYKPYSLWRFHDEAIYFDGSCCLHLLHLECV